LIDRPFQRVRATVLEFQKQSTSDVAERRGRATRVEDRPQPLPAEDGLLRLRADLVRAVTRVCPSWLSSRSDDLVQVALMKVVDVQKRGEGTADLSASYLRKVAYSAVVDEIRRCRRRSEVSLEEEQSALDRSTNGPDPERCAEGREIGLAIRGCLGKLAASRRVAVTLHLQGHSVPDAARLLGWSAKQAENLIYRGLADLRGCLGKAGVGR
jgi:RNA polymerase sigma-70 factor (ECF subfamily)